MSDIKNPGLVWSHATCIKDKAHKFEPRYDYGIPFDIRIANAPEPEEFINIINATKPQTYVYDICTKCGMIIGRKANGGGG